MYDIFYGIIIALHVAFRTLKCCNSVVDWHWTSIICIKFIEFVLICFMVYYVSFFVFVCTCRDGAASAGKPPLLPRK